MTDQFITRFQQLITPERIEKLKDIFGDEPAQISNAFSASLPVVLNAAADKASSADGAASILNSIHEVHGHHIMVDADNVFSGGGEWGHKGGNLLHGLLGDNESHVSERIADFSGAKKSTAHNILRITTLLVMDLLGSEAKVDKTDKRKLVQYLHPRMDALGAFPAGLTAAGLGLTDTSIIKGRLQDSLDVMNGTNTPEGRKKKPVWVFPLIIAGGLGVLLWWFLSGRNNMEDPVAPVVKTDTMATVVVHKATIDTVARTITLPDASTFNVSKGTMEYKLVEFLNDDSRAAGKDVWFDFDDVNFDLDKATLTPNSQVQITNIVAILKAYPQTKVKVGGYTDKTGDEKHNMKLSQERADEVLKALQSGGVPDGQLQGAEGYGSQFAKAAANATDEQRRGDRRMSLSVREK